jgi:hypothetical protein
MSILSYEIGTTYAGRVNVESLSTVANMAPRSRFFAYSETIPTINSGATTRGWPFIEWEWAGFIYADMFNSLRTICPAGSVDVIIRSLAADYVTFTYYSAKMIWPALDTYEQITVKGSLAYQGFKLRFNRPVVYTP